MKPDHWLELTVEEAHRNVMKDKPPKPQLRPMPVDYRDWLLLTFIVGCIVVVAYFAGVAFINR